MLRLRTFGGPALDGENGPRTGAAAQRRSLALLALLAGSGRDGLSREKLLGYLWPDTDAEKARHALAQSLYALRRALQGGEPVLGGAGDTLRLDPERISSDVGEFEEAIGRGELERAVALHTGPFLDGFYLSNAPEFERWAETKRAQLARQVGQALEALAIRAASRGDHRAAVEWWQRVAAGDPLNSRVALGLLRALATSGDRAGALQYARVHGALLSFELDATPDAAVAEFAEQLRVECAGGAPELHSAATDGLPAASAALQLALSPATSADQDERPDSGALDAFASEASASVLLGRGALRGANEQAAPRRRARVLLVSSLLVLVAGALAVWDFRLWPLPPAPVVPTAIAVLPFVDMSPDRENEYFSDGMTEELINALAKVPELRVVARTSSFALKGKHLDVRTIGDTLRVSTVLEGSVRRVGNRLRVTAQLIDARSGYHLWSDEYERELEDVFVVQDEISRAIVSALNVKLAGPKGGPLVSRPTESLEAYNLYLRGRYACSQRTAAALAQAVHYFEEAIARDPRYAQAYAGLADAYVLAPLYGSATPTAETWPRAQAAAERALALDSTLAEAHTALAYGKMLYAWDWRGADQGFRRAIELNPSYATAHHWYADYLAGRGRLEESLAELRRAQALDPLSRVIGAEIGRGLYFLHRPDKAVAQLQQTLQLDPHFAFGHMLLGEAYLQSGMRSEAVVELQKAVDLSGHNPIDVVILVYAYAVAGNRVAAEQLFSALRERSLGEYVLPSALAVAYTGLGEDVQAFMWLNKAVETRDPWLAEHVFEPLFDPVRSDPRFTRVLETMGLER